MRRAIISHLNNLTGSALFQYLIPNYLVMAFLAFVVGVLIALKFSKRKGFYIALPLIL
jgi:uncharacterized membrane protein SpoIIM required for sporulation